MRLRINEATETNFTDKQMNYAAGQNYVLGMKAFDEFKSAGFNPKFEWGPLDKVASKNNNNRWNIDDIDISITVSNMLFRFKASLFDYFPQRFYPQVTWSFHGYEMTSSNITIADAERLLDATKLAYKLSDEINSQFDKIIKTIESGNV